MKKVKTYKLDQVKDKVIGKKGSVEREVYEDELSLEVMQKKGIPSIKKTK